MRNSIVFSLTKSKMLYSTTTPIHQVVADIYSILNEVDHEEGVFKYLSRAFDRVNHSIPLSKVELMDFRSNAYDLVESNLTKRRQCIMIVCTS